MNEVKSINKEFIITNDFNIHNITITEDTTLNVVVKKGVKTKLIEVLNISTNSPRTFAKSIFLDNPKTNLLTP